MPLEDQGAYSSVWLERTPDKREVGGSNPPRPTSLVSGVGGSGLSRVEQHGGAVDLSSRAEAGIL